ncbi:MAG: FAD-binding protein [Cetobacterium sp.]|nr:FAD-binding protein [Cetobacterium sp.]
MINISKTIVKEVLVVGSGIGGLLTSKKLGDKKREVLLITKGTLGGGASFFPLKGTLGIQTTDDDKKDEILFKEDISKIGNKMDNPEMVETYIKESKEAISLLNEIGFTPWFRKDRRPACFAKYPRNIYLIKDWENSKKNAKEILKKYKNLEILEKTEIIKILVNKNKVIGAIIKCNKEFILVKTSVIVLATGGIGGLYKNTLYPKDIMGIGHSLALDAGASLVNMEFIQFIPGFLKPKYNVLFGEHTFKYVLEPCDENKKLWIERSAYAPFSFDFPSHKIDLQMGKGMYLKFHEDLYKDEGEFYKVYLSWLKDSQNINMCKDEIKIAPFAHSSNGGIKININGKSEVDGLYGIGEVASGIEGANRLGGNSVGGALVFGRRAVLDINNYLNQKMEISDFIYKKEINTWINSLFKEDENNLYTSKEVLLEIGNILNEHGLIMRNEDSLNLGLKKLQRLENNYSLKENILEQGFDVIYSLKMAKILLQAMKKRRESRGAHYRSDYPYTLKESSSEKISKYT